MEYTKKNGWTWIDWPWPSSRFNNILMLEVSHTDNTQELKHLPRIRLGRGCILWSMDPVALTLPTTTPHTRLKTLHTNCKPWIQMKKKTSLQCQSTHPMLSFLTGKNPSGSILDMWANIYPFICTDMYRYLFAVKISVRCPRWCTCTLAEVWSGQPYHWGKGGTEKLNFIHHLIYQPRNWKSCQWNLWPAKPVWFPWPCFWVQRPNQNLRTAIHTKRTTQSI